MTLLTPPERYKRPESVLVVVFTDAGEVLLLQRCRPPVGAWQSVTGALRWGETPGQAARRELYEETGLEAAPAPTGEVNTFEIVPEARGDYAPGVRWNTEHVYGLRLAAVCPVEPDPCEHGAHIWLPAGRALACVWSRTNRAAVRTVVGLISE